MKLKYLLISIILTLTASLCISCDDTVDSVGIGIQPDTDDIALNIGEVELKAKTTQIDDKIYIRTASTLLGDLYDPVFKNLKAEFLAEFFTSGKYTFESEGAITPVQIDSVLLHMLFTKNNFIGDSTSVMNVAVYEATKNLKPNFYTNINISDYTDMKTLLGKRYFTVEGLMDTLGYKYLTIEMQKSLGTNLLKEWQKDKSILDSPEKLSQVLKGVYVTSDFNDKAIMQIDQTSLYIHYSYKVDKVSVEEGGATDSTVYRTLPLPVTLDVLQMNKIINSPINDITDVNDNSKKTFIKAPAGVITEITIPLKEIKEMAAEKTGSENYIINSAVFKLVGMTEEENKLEITNRPNALLFINKDSINNFFVDDKMVNSDGKTGLVMMRDPNNNTYNFVSYNLYSSTSSSAFTNNIASLINYYAQEHPEIDELTYYVIPVQPDGTSSNSGTQITAVTNRFTPAAAILRTSPEYMKMSLIFSKYNNK